jgi:hypothetical protein
MERIFHLALRGRRFSSDEEVTWHGAKLVKDATKKLFFLTELKKLVKRWNRSV